MEQTDITRAFGHNLRAARKKAGLTQEELAKRLGYSAKAISKWESGSCVAPAVLLPLLAEQLSTDVNSLMRITRSPSYFVGIDGGGTKTEFVLAQKDGAILRRVVLGGSNPNDLGMPACLELLGRGIEELCRGIPRERISLFAGIAGCATGNNRESILQYLLTLGFGKCDCGSDVLNAIKATLGEENGIVVIAGTGSITFVQKDRTRHRLGGFNYLFEDGGSGYMIGREAIYDALKAEENRTADSLLYRMVLEKCETKTVLDHLGKIYEGGKSKIASFAPLVFDAARVGDGRARQILDTNAAILAREITRSAAILEEPFPRVVLLGGLTRQADLLLPLIYSHLTIECRIEIHEGSLAKGALMLAGWEEPHAENRTT